MAAGPGWQAPPASLVICVAACWPALPPIRAEHLGRTPWQAAGGRVPAPGVKKSALNIDRVIA